MSGAAQGTVVAALVTLLAAGCASAPSRSTLAAPEPGPRTNRSPNVPDPGARPRPDAASGAGQAAVDVGQRIEQERLLVLAVNKREGRVRVKGATGVPTNLACTKTTVVIADGQARQDLDFLAPGDTIRVESSPNGTVWIVVLRRAWQDLAGPEQ